MSGIHLLITVIMWTCSILGILILFSKATKATKVWGTILLIVGVAIGSHRMYGSPLLAASLPNGLNSSSKVMDYAVSNSPLELDVKGNDMWNRYFGINSSVDFRLLKNTKTKHFVFTYKFKGKTLVVYIIRNKINPVNSDSYYGATLVPVNKHDKYQFIEIERKGLPQFNQQIKRYQYITYSDQDILNKADENPEFKTSDSKDKLTDYSLVGYR
uniref:hypothetical protein n=1 Tax=Lentilactobacillus hilgardii TaxID=1588 RepID=UPI00403F46BB